MNIVEHTHDLKNIEQANVMREARKCVNKISTFERSEGEVRARLVSCHVFLVSLNHNIRIYMFIGYFLLTNYMCIGLIIEQRPRQDKIEVEFVRDKNKSHSKGGRLMSSTISVGGLV